jgi:hypothetical protein
MRAFVICLAAVVLAVPAAAFAAKPPHPAHPAHPAHPTKGAPSKTHAVTYVLKGTLSAYTAVTPANGVNPEVPGSVTITVAHSNHHGNAFKGQSLTFQLTSSTKVVLGHLTTVTPNVDRGMVKVRAPKNTDAATIQTLVPKMVIDQGSAH